MLKFTLTSFVIGWGFIIAVAFGLIAQDSRLGFGPLVFLMMATMVGGSGAIEDDENRVPFLLLAVAAFASCMLYAVMRYFMLFSWGGR